MLEQKNRLKKKKDFERVWKKGKRFQHGFLSLKIVKNDLRNSRFAFVVGLKVSKKAVVRNKIKRRLRHIIKREMPRIKSGIDVSIIALPCLENKDFQELKDITNKLLKKSNIINRDD